MDKNKTTWEEVAKDTKEAKIEALLREALPYYDSDYDGAWTMPLLIAKIVEVCAEDYDG